VKAKAKFHITPLAIASTNGFGVRRRAINPQMQ
jgi:hypothetical protein